ncbi:MAG: hypothetical protein ACQKBW_09940 [Puniceicoccales bacterium]
MFKRLISYLRMCKAVDDDVERTLALPLDKALADLFAFIQENTGDVEFEVTDQNAMTAHIPDSIDWVTRELFAHYTKLYLVDSDALIVFGDYHPEINGFQVAQSGSDCYKVYIRNGSEKVYVISDANLEEEYPSIAHYILIALPSYSAS